MKDFRRVFRFVRKEDSLYLFLVLLQTALAVLSPFVLSFFSSIIIDKILAQESFSSILLLAGLGAIISLVLFLLSALLSPIVEGRSLELEERLQNRMDQKALSLSYATLESKEVKGLLDQSELMSRTFGGINQAMGSFTTALLGFFSFLYALVVFLFVLLLRRETTGFSYLSSPLSDLTVVLLAILCSLLSVKARSLYSKRMTREMDKATDVNRRFTAYVGILTSKDLHKDVRLYQMKEGVLYRMKEGIQPLINLLSGMNVTASWTCALSVLPTIALFLGSYLIYGFMAYEGFLSVGNVVLASSAAVNLQAAFSNIFSGLFNAYQVCHSESYSFAFLDLKSKDDSGERITFPISRPSFTFDHVSFSYPGEGESVLKDVSFTIPFGKKMALVGPNGAGKSTIVKLLTRLYVPDSGKILIDGKDINDFAFEDYQKEVAAVFQDFFLLEDSIEKNVAGSKRMDKIAIQDALRKAGVLERIEKTKKGMGTHFGTELDKEGVSFSGGESQKIAIARALYKDSPLVLLDEPTSALDPISEQEIYESFLRLIQGRSALFISHRMSSTRYCDDILVLDKGQIVERGTHEALMAKENSLYKKMFLSQAQYYQK